MNIFQKVGVGLAVCVISVNSFGYSVYEEEKLTVNATLDGIYGVFHSDKTYDPLGVGNPNGPGSVAWQEGVLDYGIEAQWRLGMHESTLKARISGVSTATWGDGDAAGFTAGTERKTDLEDAWLSWQSGSALPWLGYNGLEISAGRQFASLGDGFLLHGDVVSFGKGSLYPTIQNRGGAYFLAGREAFANSFVLRLGGEEGWRSDLMWLDSDNPIQDKMEMLISNLEYVAEEGTVGFSYLHGLDADSGDPNFRSARDGMHVYSLRAAGNAGVDDLFLSAEYVYQDLSEQREHEKAWYLEAGWQFSQLWGEPYTSYRYSRFSSGYDTLFYGFGRGFGTWYQGEVAANYAGPLSTNSAIQQLNFTFSPRENLSVSAMLFDFKTDEKQAENLDGQEFDVFLEWEILPNVALIPLVGVYKAKHGIAEGGTQLGRKGHNLYGQLIVFVSF